MTVFEIIGTLFFLCLGFYLFSFGFKKYIALKKLKKSGNPTTGEVIEIKKNNLSYTPIISFRDTQNKKIEGVANNSISVKYFSFHKIGDKLDIFYHPENSADFSIDELSDKIIASFFCVGGLVFISAMLYEVIRRLI